MSTSFLVNSNMETALSCGPFIFFEYVQCHFPEFEHYMITLSSDMRSFPMSSWPRCNIQTFLYILTRDIISPISPSFLQWNQHYAPYFLQRKENIYLIKKIQKKISLSSFHMQSYMSKSEMTFDMKNSKVGINGCKHVDIVHVPSLHWQRMSGTTSIAREKRNSCQADLHENVAPLKKKKQENDLEEKACLIGKQWVEKDVILDTQIQDMFIMVTNMMQGETMMMWERWSIWLNMQACTDEQLSRCCRYDFYNVQCHSKVAMI